jgi:hypothetical protein
MTATAFALTEAATSTGVLRAFIGDPFTEDGLVALPTEGEIREPSLLELNMMTAGELTGGVPLSASVQMTNPTVTVPVIWTGATMAALLSPTGSASVGHSAPQEPTYTSLVLIPLSELDQTDDPPTISYAATTWAPAAPANARWYWKVVPVMPEMTSAYENNGKVILPVTFQVFYDFDRPAGHRVRTYGNPAAQGITTIAI